MKQADPTARWKQAGAANLRFNAPLGAERAAGLVAAVTAHDPDLIVDLGCGRGELLLECCAAGPRGVGIDTDGEAIEAGRSAARARGLAVEFVCDTADAWSGQAQAALCVASAHALGGLGATLDRIGELVPEGRLAIGDGCWQQPPDAWCEEVFGPLPDGPDGQADAAVERGWRVVSLETSTQAEWDAFERGWGNGVRSLGEPEADAFAAERWAEYTDHYRGVLGFAWLVAER